MSSESKLTALEYNSLKIDAKAALTQALQRGGLKTAEHCENCNRTRTETGNAAIQGHHYDYLKPLDVIWFCIVCHSTRAQ